MISAQSAALLPKCEVRIHSGQKGWHLPRRLEKFLLNRWPVPLSRHPAWMSVLRRGQQLPTGAQRDTPDSTYVPREGKMAGSPRLP